MSGWKQILVYSLSLGLGLPSLGLSATNAITNPSGPAVIQTDKGTVIINTIQGISPEQHEALAKQLGVTEQALSTFIIIIIERQQVPLADLDKTLRQIAEHYKELLERVRTLSSDDPAVAQLRDTAIEAIEVGEFERAERLLNEASAKDQAAA